MCEMGEYIACWARLSRGTVWKPSCAAGKGSGPVVQSATIYNYAAWRFCFPLPNRKDHGMSTGCYGNVP